MQIASNQYPLSTPGNDLPSDNYLDINGKKINPALWAIRELQKSGVTVMRTFGAGVTTDFKMILQPGTAGADGKTWPNGERCCVLDGVRLQAVSDCPACMGQRCQRASRPLADVCICRCGHAQASTTGTL